MTLGNSLLGGTADKIEDWIADPIDTPPVRLIDLKIRTKDRRLLSFAPNPVQASYLDLICPGWRDGSFGVRGLREDVLKARQEGMSTLILALIFLDTINTPYTYSLILAHDADSTERLFGMIHRFWENLPEGKRRAKKYSSKRELLFSDIDSGLYVATAGAGNVGRSGTWNNVHMSERAKWKSANPGELQAGLLEAVPADGNVWKETTAGGLNDYYHDYKEEQAGRSRFTPRFFPWFLHTDYRTEPRTDFLPTDEEERIASDYGLDLWQLQWRRDKVLDLKGLFPQEYPSHPDDAFLASGNPYFDRMLLKEWADTLASGRYDPLPFAAVADAPLPPSGRLVAALRDGTLTLWGVPTDGAQYVIAADTAEGLTDSGDTDFDSADVLDAVTWTQVAHLHGKWDTHEYGLLLADLGRWYNTALLGIERNNHGHAVINAVLHAAEYPPMQPGGYSGLYYHEEYDETKDMDSRRPGWPTTVKTKYFALDGLATSLTEKSLHLRSPETVAELLTFVKKPGGRAGGDGNSHDDRVMSLAIADALLKLKPAPVVASAQSFQYSYRGAKPRR
jgi:hypothetical protein